MVKRFLIPTALVLILFSSCEISQKDFNPETDFIKIFNDPNEAHSYFPVSIKELKGEGYIILTGIKNDSLEIEYPKAGLIKISKTGKVIWTRQTNWLAPVNEVFISGREAIFVAMNGQSLASVISFDVENGEIKKETSLDIALPLAAKRSVSGKLIVLSYDNISRSSIITSYSEIFAKENSLELKINTDLQNIIQKHLNKSGTQYPFFITEWNYEQEMGYMINCFYNYTLRSVILSQNLRDIKGDIYSFQTEAAISSLISKDSSKLALTRYYDGNNYLIKDVKVNFNVSQNFNDIQGNILQELSHNAPVKAEMISLKGRKCMIFASQTNSNSIILYQYFPDKPEYERKLVYDFQNKTEIADIQQTADEGLILLVRTYLLGKFKRPAIIRIPVEKLD